MIQLQALLKERSQNRQGQNTSKQKHPRLKQKSNPQNSQWLGQAANNQETRSNSPRYKSTKAKQGTTETYMWPSMVTHTRNLCSRSKQGRNHVQFLYILYIYIYIYIYALIDARTHIITRTQRLVNTTP